VKSLATGRFTTPAPVLESDYGYPRTDAITMVAQGHVPDEVWAEACRHFGPSELARLVWTVVAINSWNRIAIATRMPPASHGNG
jgi:hypothetical protein